METTTLQDAESQFSRLIERAAAGEEVVIVREGKPVAKLIPYHPIDTPREGGQWKGKVHIAKDFDELPDDLAAAFGTTSE